MELNLNSFDKTTTEIDTLMPFIKYPTGTKESVRQHCLSHIFSYYGGISNKYIYGNPPEPIPDYLIKENLDICESSADPKLKDMCLASIADSANYKAGFYGFCEKIGNSIEGLKENCIALRAQNRN